MVVKYFKTLAPGGFPMVAVEKCSWMQQKVNYLDAINILHQKMKFLKFFIFYIFIVQQLNEKRLSNFNRCHRGMPGPVL